MSTPAVLALEDGTVFRGLSVGAKGNTTGEVVFNTAMTGYQEILSDPSYAGQIVTFSNAEVGNYGCNEADMESRSLFLAGLVIQNLNEPSNFRSQESLAAFLQRYHSRTRPTAQSLWLGVAIEQASDGDPQLRREYSTLLLSQFPNSDEARRLKPSK